MRPTTFAPPPPQFWQTTIRTVVWIRDLTLLMVGAALLLSPIVAGMRLYYRRPAPSVARLKIISEAIAEHFMGQAQRLKRLR